MHCRYGCATATNQSGQSETAKLLDPNQDYELQKKLGEGSFGAVYFGINRQTGEEVAIKRLNVTDQKALDSILKEISLMKGVENEHIVKYHGNYFWSKQIWIVMEYAGAGSLSDVLDARAKATPPRGFKDESHIAAVSVGILKGLSFMHARNTVHRDIKSDNVLINSAGVVKLADFGISRKISESESKMHTMIGTPHYLAPEVLRAEAGQGYTSKVDVWAFGTCALEMADGKPPYAHLGPIKVLFELSNNPKIGLKKPAAWTADFNTFVQRCVVPEPTGRASVDELLAHAFLRGAPSALDLAAASGAGGSAPGSASAHAWRGAGGVAVVAGDNEVKSLDSAQRAAPDPANAGGDLYGYWEPGVVFKNLNREQAEEQLKIWGPGSYLVRPSSQKSCLSCTYRVGVGQPDAGRIGHLLLVRPSKQVPGWTCDGRPSPYPNILGLLLSLPYNLSMEMRN